MKSPKDILALGQEIVRELQLDARGAVLERWLAHHLAQLMSEADRTTGLEKAAAERRAVGLILRLWKHRRALPERVDPLGGLRDAIEILGLLNPAADPWRRSPRNRPYDDILHEIFEAMCGVVAGGILLTHMVDARPLPEAAARMLEEEERSLHAELERWLAFFRSAPEPQVIEFRVVESDDTMDGESEPDQSEPAPGSDRHGNSVNSAALHEMIEANLERIRGDLGQLLVRWRRAAPPEAESEVQVDDVVPSEDD